MKINEKSFVHYVWKLNNKKKNVVKSGKSWLSILLRQYVTKIRFLILFLKSIMFRYSTN